MKESGEKKKRNERKFFQSNEERDRSLEDTIKKNYNTRKWKQ